MKASSQRHNAGLFVTWGGGVTQLWFNRSVNPLTIPPAHCSAMPYNGFDATIRLTDRYLTSAGLPLDDGGQHGKRDRHQQGSAGPGSLSR
jgi:hypothetical protein